MNLSKSYEFFRPEDCSRRIHIIGCGAVGSTVAENLARLGITNIALYDFDTVEPKNIANQMFTEQDIGKLKVDAVNEMICRINSDAQGQITLFKEGYTDQKLSGHIFLCVDNIDLRREICEKNKNNPFIESVWDFRMGLTTAQHFSADWKNMRSIKQLLDTMQFTHEEAAAETPVSACNQVLSVAPTVRMLVACGIANFMNYIKKAGRKSMILIDAFNFMVDSYD